MSHFLITQQIQIFLHLNLYMRRLAAELYYSFIELMENLYMTKLYLQILLILYVDTQCVFGTIFTWPFNHPLYGG